MKNRNVRPISLISTLEKVDSLYNMIRFQMKLKYLKEGQAYCYTCIQRWTSINSGSRSYKFVPVVNKTILLRNKRKGLCNLQSLCKNQKSLSRKFMKENKL